MIAPIMPSASKQRYLSLIVFWVWLGLADTGIFHRANPPAPQTKDACIGCHSRLKDRAGEVVAIYQTSAHGRVSVGCDGCHGGDSSQSDKSKAHAGHFIARPDPSATLEMCGACHSKPLEYFKGSRHVAARPNAARLDCVECHGVHGIGAASESFRWPQFCAGCHGLEYLPQLPKPFQEMLALSDDLREGMHALEAKNRAQTNLVRQRKEIRNMISDLVHRTDARRGAESVLHILELGATLKQQITTEQNR